MSPDGGRALSRTLSLVINSPTKNSTPGKRPAKIVVETVPDSQEETIGEPSLYKGDIIDLSSDSDDDRDRETRRKATHANDSDPFLSPARNIASVSAKPSSNEVIDESSTENDSDDQPRYVPRSVKSRRAVVSDSEDESEQEEQLDGFKNRTDTEPGDDGAVLVLNDPPSSRKPAVRDDVPSSTPKPKRPPVVPLVQSTSSGGQVVVVDPLLGEASDLLLPKRTPGKQALLPDYFTPKGKAKNKDVTKETGDAGTIAPALSTTTAPITPSRLKSAVKRRTKKVIEQEKQAHLVAYAQALFDELNASVFKGRLPKDTPLVWNKRLLATAGRAKWHRDSKGAVTTSIELATKVLDCEERIRNSLSHEMCHLACWVINCNPKENHGRVWQGWVDKVMEKRPDIAISTKHSYDIQYKYEWQCQTVTCKKIYGRFSNSIDPSRSVCGVCKVGELLPLFKVRTRKAKVTSNLAADKPRDSPILSAARPTGPGAPIPSPLKNKSDNGVILIMSDTESDREPLSGTETDVDNCPDTGDLGDEVQVIKKPKASDKNTRKDKLTDTEDMHKLMTQMSIIDLTSD